MALAVRDAIDFTVLCEPVARRLWGEPNATLSKGDDLRWGAHGSRSVDLRRGLWFDHEAGIGGRTIDLICHVLDCDKPAALSWLMREGLPARAVDPARQASPQTLREVATYNYTDEAGVLLYQVVRYEPKAFRQRQPNSVGGWTWKMDGARRVLYRLPEAIKAIEENRFVCVVEGERDADALRKIGITATTNAGGAGKWLAPYSEALRGAKVVVVGDNDDAGRAHVHSVASALHGVAAELRVVDLATHWPDCPPKGDVSDWLDRGGGSKDALREIVKQTPIWKPSDGGSGANSSGPAADSAAKDEWPEPKPLPIGLSPVEPFDLALLPTTIAPWVADICERIQCPPDYVGVPAMVALGAVLGRRIGVRPQRHTDRLEVPNVWGCIVGRPGMMKSPAMAEALKPLHRLEAEAQKSNDEARKDHAAALEAHKLRVDVARTAAKKALGQGGNPIEILRLDEPEAPKVRRYVTNDCSYEALGEILADNPNGVLAFRDELVSLLKTLDREEYAAARGFFLSAWNGTSGYTFDRIIRGHTRIDAACVSLLGSTQPSRLEEHMRRAVSGGAGDDGLIQRFGLLVWPDGSPEWVNVDRQPNSAARQAAWATFERLDKVTADDLGAQRDQFEVVPFLRFDNEAQEIFDEWRMKFEARLRSGDLHPALESHLAKYRKLVPALALICSIVDGGTRAIDGAAVLRAPAFAEFLEPHARRCFAAGSEAETTAAKAILSRIRKGDLADGFTCRDVHQRNWSNLSAPEQVQAGINMLVDYDWLTSKPNTIGRAGGRPKVVYRVNPRASR
jgi:Protein of unknown function (DUF3987)